MPHKHKRNSTADRKHLFHQFLASHSRRSVKGRCELFFIFRTAFARSNPPVGCFPIASTEHDALMKDSHTEYCDHYHGPFQNHERDFGVGDGTVETASKLNDTINATD